MNIIEYVKSAKEIWRLLELTLEGTNQVKESKINLLVHNYELFSMKENETIVEIITRSTNIVVFEKILKNPIHPLPPFWVFFLIKHSLYFLRII